VLRQRLEANGAFDGDTELWAGFGAPPGGVFAGAALNRPSAPAFCQHGVLHVSSFVTEESAGHEALAARRMKRAVYKFASHASLAKLKRMGGGECYPGGLPPFSGGLCVGWLQANHEGAEPNQGDELLRDAWGVSFALDDAGGAFVCGQADDDQPDPVVRLERCGCSNAVVTSPGPPAQPSAFDYGRATALGIKCGGSARVKQANYILALRPYAVTL
jgi:hypothetical protein